MDSPLLYAIESVALGAISVIGAQVASRLGAGGANLPTSR
tara:strand:- start:398 stop:517 length:120 start_codon:yes stop_codon:yes gene_type:complete